MCYVALSLCARNCFRNLVCGSSFTDNPVAKPRPQAPNIGKTINSAHIYHYQFYKNFCKRIATFSMVFKEVSTPIFYSIATVMPPFSLFCRRISYLPLLAPRENMCFILSQIKEQLLNQCNNNKFNKLQKSKAQIMIVSSKV